MEGGGYLNTRPYSAGLPRARSPINTSVSDISRPVMTSSITASLDGESETEMSQLLNRTRQKKFIKNFKQLPSEELVLQRYSCALVGDILLQGHLYVTENYIAFHSNVFGYITRIEIPMLSVSGITKEKTAKIIPNAVGVTTLEETHIFSSLISREGTFKVMTKAWKKALAKHNLTTLNGVIENGDEDEDDGVDRELVDEESTDSMVSASQILPIGLSRQPELDSRSPFLMKRVSNTSGALFYQARTSPPPPPTLPNSKEGNLKGKGKLSRLIFSLLSLPTHSKFLSCLTLLLFLLLCTSFYLVFRLGSIQEKVEAFLPSYPENLEQISSWQKVLHYQSSLKVDQYLQSNLHQLAKVRENLDRLSSLLQVKEKDEFR
ncbi:GRAM domain-containing protein 2B [Eurytemora carolleeae]|uniref:GRAM domain-containing protein 2B n=1 Tax=Eurytemora carolleeae TaxID=1294199 RepID=UPI000C7755E2|nr:GRAM domain-containing protein 2B [Eurytemora carolleeae]|eukprot:XP_023348527.1 GRAM domain-containing protein 2B-like [Eurytemora affinis]